MITRYSISFLLVVGLSGRLSAMDSATDISLEKYGFTETGNVADRAKLMKELTILFKANKFNEYFALLYALPLAAGVTVRTISIPSLIDPLGGALHWAAYHNNLSAILKLYAQHVPLNLANDERETAMNIAARRNKVEAIRFLCMLGASLMRPTRSDEMEQTPMHSAAENGCVDAILCLSELGHPLEGDDKSYTPLFRACVNGQTEAFTALIQLGARNAFHRLPKWTHLHSAAMLGAIKSMEILLNEGEGLKAKDEEGMTPLHCAAMGNQLEAIEFLIKKGAIVNAKNGEGETPLHIAAKYNHISAIRCLVQCGASMDDCDNYERRPFEVGLMTRFEDKENILPCFVELGLNINSKDKKGQTLAHYAAMCPHNNSDVLHYLHARGIDFFTPDSNGLRAIDYDRAKHMSLILRLEDTSGPNGKREHGNTLLIDVAQKGFVTLIKTVLDDSRLEINSKNEEGNTALHVAAQEGHVDCVRLLLQDGRIDKYSQNNEGNTAFHLAVRSNRPRVIACFLLFNTSTTQPLNKNGRSVAYLAQFSHESKMMCDCEAALAIVPEKHSQIVTDQSIAMSLTAEEKASEEFKRILDMHGPNYKRNGRTLLMEAAWQNSHTVVATLLTHPDIDVNAIGNNGNTALHLASKLQVIKLLLQHKNIQPYIQNDKGNTPFHEICSRDSDGDAVLCYLQNNIRTDWPLNDTQQSVNDLLHKSSNRIVLAHYTMLKEIFSSVDRIKTLPLEIQRILADYAIRTIKPT